VPVRQLEVSNTCQLRQRSQLGLSVRVPRIHRVSYKSKHTDGHTKTCGPVDVCGMPQLLRRNPREPGRSGFSGLQGLAGLSDSALVEHGEEGADPIPRLPVVPGQGKQHLSHRKTGQAAITTAALQAFMTRTSARARG
jgi:hypothetical protein